MESEIVARKVCAYYVKLISRASVPVRPVHESQLEEGLWKIAGHADCCVAEIVGDSNLPFVLREEIIRSMADLFRLLFVTEPLDTSVFMCWDALCYDWHCGNRSRERGGEDEQLQNVFFVTLADVLAIDSWICQEGCFARVGSPSSSPHRRTDWKGC
jgi:hypothetical protein